MQWGAKTLGKCNSFIPGIRKPLMDSADGSLELCEVRLILYEFGQGSGRGAVYRRDEWLEYWTHKEDVFNRLERGVVAWTVAIWNN